MWRCHSGSCPADVPWTGSGQSRSPRRGRDAGATKNRGSQSRCKAATESPNFYRLKDPLLDLFGFAVVLDEAVVIVLASHVVVPVDVTGRH